MRNIIAGLFISLDGVVEAPEKWHFPYFNDEMGQVVESQMAATDSMLLGRVTYQDFAAYWPNVSGEDQQIADFMNGRPKYVVSTTLKTADWQNSTLINGDIPQAIAKLKQQPGKDISITGSPTLVRSLLQNDLLDQLALLVHPVVVGTGKRLFTDGGNLKRLQLVDSKTFTTGVLALTYVPAPQE
jgi:dihydrofolate reductase